MDIRTQLYVIHAPVRQARACGVRLLDPPMSIEQM